MMNAKIRHEVSHSTRPRPDVANHPSNTAAMDRNETCRDRGLTMLYLFVIIRVFIHAHMLSPHCLVVILHTRLLWAFYNEWMNERKKNSSACKVIGLHCSNSRRLLWNFAVQKYLDVIGDGCRLPRGLLALVVSVWLMPVVVEAPTL